MQLGGISIGDDQPVFMVAEIGLNHNADMQICKRLIDAVFACGWHCVKFQKRTPEICVPEDQKLIPRDTPWGRMTYIDYRKKIEFGFDEYSYINIYCEEKPILWTASAWDLESLEFLLFFDVPFLKIPSAKLTDHFLLRRAVQSGKPIILSTGMSTVKEIDDAVEILEGSKYALMHTNSTYPTPPEDINLLTIGFLKDRYKCVVGYSGHEYGLDPSSTAVALGARIIERHITLDHRMWGSDQKASLEIHAMDMLHKRIKETLISLGDGIKRVTESEKPLIQRLRGEKIWPQRATS